jgi:hypothetical protein
MRIPPGPGPRRALIAAIGLGPLLALGHPPAHAATEVDGGSGPAGVVITVVEWEGRRSVHLEGRTDQCHYTLESGPPGFSPEPGAVPDRPPDSFLAVLACDGTALGLIWVGPHNTVDLAATADALARRWVSTVPTPSVRVRTSPPGRGLTGVETWMWLDGAGPPSRRASLEAFGIPIDVVMVAGPVTWDFGDGTGLTAGPGQPDRPAVGHGYTRSSSEATGPYRLVARYELEPAYRVASGPWLALPPIVVDAERDYPVSEAQAILG